MCPTDYLMFLMAEGEVFINNGWWKEKDGWPKDQVTLHLHAGEMEINFADLQSIYEICRADPVYGTSAWAIARLQAPPAHRFRESLEAAGWDVQGLLEGKPPIECYTPREKASPPPV